VINDTDRSFSTVFSALAISYGLSSGFHCAWLPGATYINIYNPSTVFEASVTITYVY